MHQSLGDKIKEARLKSGQSLRKFAENIKITPAFMSDIELGRRFPSDDVLQKIAAALQIPFSELKASDVRESLTDLRKLIHENEEWGLAFRAVSEQVKSGLTPQELIRKLSPDKSGGEKANESD